MPLVTKKCGYTCVVEGQSCEKVTLYTDVRLVAFAMESEGEGRARAKLPDQRRQASRDLNLVRQTEWAVGCRQIDHLNT